MNAAINALTTSTTIVILMVCARLGQVTLASSERTSKKNPKTLVGIMNNFRRILSQSQESVKQSVHVVKQTLPVLPFFSFVVWIQG
jgi:hypothetical protein